MATQRLFREALHLIERERPQLASVEEAGRRSAQDATPPDEGEMGPRGISIRNHATRRRGTIGLNLDISAILSLLLKELGASEREKELSDPVAGEDDDRDSSDDQHSARDDDETLSTRTWEDVVRAVRPRITRLLNRLEDRLAEEHSPKWKYERVLLTLALLKRMRKFHPSDRIPFDRVPERLADDDQVYGAFKMAMHCWFARDIGIIRALDRLGGVDDEYDAVGRALLLWAAYEAGVDVASPQSFDGEDIDEVQADRMDALIAAVAAAASSDALDRARRELRDRGDWQTHLDRPDLIDLWFTRHAEIGKAIQRALAGPSARLPTAAGRPTIRDIVVWQSEPGWPRLPKMVSERALHLADVGDAESVRVLSKFVKVVDLNALRINKLISSDAHT